MTAPQNPAQDVSDLLDALADICDTVQRGDGSQTYSANGHSDAADIAHAAITKWEAARELQQAQVVGFDRQPETSRRMAAVLHMLADGWNWDGLAWVRPPQSSAPVVDDEMVALFQRVYMQNFVEGRAMQVAERTKRALAVALESALTGRG